MLYVMMQTGHHSDSDTRLMKLPAICVFLILLFINLSIIIYLFNFVEGGGGIFCALINRRSTQYILPYMS